MYKVTTQQISAFLENVLELSVDDIANRHINKLRFLRNLCSAYDCHIPLQNLTTTTVPFAERHQPTLQENIHSVFTQLGGRCWALNGVMYVLLKELCYDVKALLSSLYEEGANNHMMLLAENIQTPGDRYLIDVGFGGTSHEPVALDFDTVSPVYKAGHQTTRWLKRSDKYIRQDLLKPVIGHKLKHIEGEWGNSIYFNLEAQSVELIGRSIDDKGYSNPKFFFNVTRRITGTNKDLNKFVAILNDKLLVEGDDHRLQKSVLENDEAIVAAVKKYFPTFPSDAVRRSYQIWHQHDKDRK